MNTENRRQFTRIIFSAPVEARQGSHKWECRLLDISLKGVLLEAPEHFTASHEDSLLLVVTLPGISSSLMMEGQIKHQDDHQIGIKINMLDIDSASRLRRLVELNVGDDTLLKRELEKLANPETN
ncbi:PilZ domain-containing protein [Lacimicrobium sp. SS2-24]|uniref:PilZ domain-containing protein n=1 Tax=Lacimicrobium sp. SS2-24 TaxID=2005569 RepID=UPI000B4BEBE2|nr:PilZ domain-containing protein [Lacimicrobium sp. SS2-24]